MVGITFMVFITFMGDTHLSQLFLMKAFWLIYSTFHSVARKTLFCTLRATGNSRNKSADDSMKNSYAVGYEVRTFPVPPKLMVLIVSGLPSMLHVQSPGSPKKHAVYSAISKAGLVPT